MMDMSLENNCFVDLCQIFPVLVSWNNGSCWEDVFVDCVGIKEMDVLYDDGCSGRHSGVICAHPCNFCYLRVLCLVRKLDCSVQGRGHSKGSKFW